ncbi:hypothetical protein HX13_09860 [Chryseobacterium sp. P1-3]|nr:hypothetical protein HX13_09860 [Chryseobacterium sp. P1-3]
MSYAQDKVYVSNQTNQITGFCALCFMQNGQNVVGSNENDYATMILPLGVSGRISQTLFFPATTKKNNKSSYWYWFRKYSVIPSVIRRCVHRDIYGEYF